MSQQHQEQFEEDEDNSTIAADEFVRLVPTTPNGTNDGNAHDVLSSPVYCISDGDDDLNELKLKMAALELINHILEGKLEKLELKVKIHELEKEKIEQKMHGMEQNAQIANNRFESTIQLIQKEMAILKEQQQQPQKEQQTIKLNDSKSNSLLSHLDKAVIVNNPIGNNWMCSDKTNPISLDGLRACSEWSSPYIWRSIFAEKGFLISGKLCRPVVYYFEVERTSLRPDCGFRVGLSKGSLPEGTVYVGHLPNTYAIQHGHDSCILAGTRHWFEWPTGAIRPEWNGRGDVMGCGILLNAKNEMAIFFTANGILLGKQIPIIHPAGDDRLFPTVNFRNASLEANFGDDSSKPFKYDVIKCSGLILE